MTPEEFTKFIATNEVDKIQSAFDTRKDIVLENLKQYNIKEHEVNKHHLLQDKHVEDSQGKPKTVKQWRLTLPWQKKIVESTVTWLFGKDVKLNQISKGTDDVLADIQGLWKDLRLHALNREAAYLLYSETEFARLYVPYTDKDKQGQLACMLLAQSRGDTLYTKFNEFGKMEYFARRYEIKAGDKTIEHFDIYSAEWIYKCTKTDATWLIVPERNKIGKIPAAYYKIPQTDWADVQPLIERIEWLMSTRGGVNDATADPILILEGEIISLPDRHDIAKVVQLQNGGKASYLSPQMVIEMVKDERETLEEAITFFTSTVDLSQKEQSRVGTADSGVALQMKYFAAIMKALDRQGLWMEMLDREISIQKAFLKHAKVPGVTDEHKTKRSQLDKLEIKLEFGNPLPDNIKEQIEMYSQAVGGKEMMSQKAAFEKNPLNENGAEDYAQHVEEQKAQQNTLEM